MKLYQNILLAVFVLMSVSCKSEESKKDKVVPSFTLESDDYGITTEFPSSLPKSYTQYFTRYAGFKAPNGKYIHIVAQDQLTTLQIYRCRNILQFYLTNVPETLYGQDKTMVANHIADSGAVLLLMNGQDDGTNDPRVEGQPLYCNEIQHEGGDWYMNQNYEHRDASYEEILHFMHDYGIGVDGPNAQEGALPEFQKVIRAAQKHALSNTLWGIGSTDWIRELTQENSLSQEYLASVVDSYYGLWGAFTEAPGKGMWGLYIAKDRQEIHQEDPQGESVMQAYFSPTITYLAKIDSTFKGTFSMAYDAALPYTHHAQYLTKVQLLGSHPTNVVANEWGNMIIGNKGENTVIIRGNSSDYEITSHGKQRRIHPKGGTAKKDIVIENIEKIQFNDQTL